MDYRRMGNIMELNAGNKMSATSSDQWRHIWKSSRWIVLRIEALVLVAIIISFFLAAFGSCRRWSNRWIVQKGFFVAQALSLSLGTYSIGLMQSSSVKSEIYPIWTVSLFTLFGCIDPVTGYNGLDYQGPLIKMLYGIFLYCGYVLLMSISTMSSNVLKTAIIMLSFITFIKGVHRSLALVQQSRTRSMIQELYTLYSYNIEWGYDYSGQSALRRERSRMIVGPELVTLKSIVGNLKELKDERLSCCYDVCVAFSLSHELQRHLLRLVDWKEEPSDLKDIDYKWAMRVIEIELAFLYESFFTGNSFFCYYQAKTTSFWAVASFIGICFMGIAVAVAMTTSHHGDGGSTACTKVVETTTADLVITFLVLVSLALLQLMHLIRCWTSFWARVTVACACARIKLKLSRFYDDDRIIVSWRRRARWLRLKMSVATSINWFDKYLWQGKIGQCSVVPKGRLLTTGINQKEEDPLRGYYRSNEEENAETNLVARMLGLDYIWEVLRDLLGSDTKRAGVRLDDDIKVSVVEFLSTIESNRLDQRWFSFSFTCKGLRMLDWLCAPERHLEENPSYIKCVMAWQAATWLCQIAEAEQEKQDDVNKSEQRQAGRGGGEIDDNSRDHRRVAIALSNYCSYLAVSAPELISGSVSPDLAKHKYLDFVKWVRTVLTTYGSALETIRYICAQENEYVYNRVFLCKEEDGDRRYWSNVFLALTIELFSLDATRRWKILSAVWVQLLVLGAPHGNMEAHMRHLSQGGEFITHLWALLYHLGIREWKPRVRNLHNITTIDSATRILEGRDEYDHAHAVVAYVENLSV